MDKPKSSLARQMAQAAAKCIVRTDAHPRVCCPNPDERLHGTRATPTISLCDPIGNGRCILILCCNACKTRFWRN